MSRGLLGSSPLCYRGTVTKQAVLFAVVASTLALLLVPAPFANAAPENRPALCGGPVPPGPLVQPPSLEMSSAPLDDQGVHELILRAYNAGERFCFRYELRGREEHVAPILLVHPGETFAIRIVNELDGPAPGATMPASALPPCSPMSMKVVPKRRFVGYMDHELVTETMSMKDVDVNLHLHGFEGSAHQDDPFLSSLSTPAHACEYVYSVPLTQPPGTYFYHPHAHGMADDEVAGGLAGVWVVQPAKPVIPPADDHVILLQYRVPFESAYEFMPNLGALDTKAIKHEAALKPASAVKFDPFDPPPWPSAYPIAAGNVKIPACGTRAPTVAAVNGVDAPATLTVPAGTPQLLRVVNAFSDSIAFLRLRDANGVQIPLKVVGRDGIPVGGDDAHPRARYEAEREGALVPAGRLDLLLTLKPGEKVTLYSAAECTAPADELKVPQDFVTIAAGPPGAPPPALVSRPVQPSHDAASSLVAYVKAHPSLVRRRAFTYSEYVFDSPNGQPGYDSYYVTETSNPTFVEHPFWPEYAKGARAPMPDVVVKRGTVEEWYLFNTTMEVHSFHIHQMSFVDLSAPGGPQREDTVLVPFGKLLPNPKDPDYPLIQPSVTRVLLDFRNVPRGTFVFHCHMLFHEDHGMMGVIRVV